MQLPRATRLVIRIAGERMYLWRAVDHEGEVLDMLVQRRPSVAPALNQHVEDLALVIDGAPEVHPLPGDPHHQASGAGQLHPALSQNRT